MGLAVEEVGIRREKPNNLLSELLEPVDAPTTIVCSLVEISKRRIVPLVLDCKSDG